MFSVSIVTRAGSFRLNVTETRQCVKLLSVGYTAKGRIGVAVGEVDGPLRHGKKILKKKQEK